MHSTTNVVRKFEHGPLAYFLSAQKPQSYANDNHGEKISEEMLEAALRHFAVHGLGAARSARHKAEQAFFAGQQREYRWWLGICRILDQRMAMIVARKLEPGARTGCD